MKQFQLLCQIRQILSTVTFGASDAFVSCHVLNLTYIVCLEPVHYNTYLNLPGIFYLRIDPLY